MRLAAAGLLAILGAATGRDLQACGDKFLVISRNTRYKRAAAPRQPAAILVYANPSSNVPRALATVPVEATLRNAGYQPITVMTAGELDSALAQGPWDLIIADAAEVPIFKSRFPGDAAPVLLPVLYKASRAELARARKQHPVVLEGPTKIQEFLDAVDDALAERPRAPGSAAPARAAG